MQTVGCSVVSDPLDRSKARPSSIHTFAASLDRMASVMASLSSCADIKRFGCQEVVCQLYIEQPYYDQDTFENIHPYANLSSLDTGGVFTRLTLSLFLRDLKIMNGLVIELGGTYSQMSYRMHYF